MDTYERSLQRKDISVNVWATERSIKAFPDTVGKLADLAVKPEFTLNHRNLFTAIPKLLQIDALLNTVESTLSAHKVPYALIRMANAAGLQTFTLQHGLELAGLTYLDGIYGPEVRFAARTVFTWGPVDQLPKVVSEETRRKCVAVGCPKQHLIGRHEPITDRSGRPIIAVFDSVPGPRFDDRYMGLFYQDLTKMALRHPNLSFVLKPHPGPRVRSQQHAEFLASLRGVEVLEPALSASAQWTTLWLLSHARGVITPTSTIALDAALAGTPVAVTRYGQTIPYYRYYEPLPFIDETGDWIRFLEALMQNPTVLKRAVENFLNKAVLSGDAANRILDVVVKRSQIR
jgi:hypothetical protein